MVPSTLLPEWFLQNRTLTPGLPPWTPVGYCSPTAYCPLKGPSGSVTWPWPTSSLLTLSFWSPLTLQAAFRVYRNTTTVTLRRFGPSCCTAPTPAGRRLPLCALLPCTCNVHLLSSHAKPRTCLLGWRSLPPWTRSWAHCLHECRPADWLNEECVRALASARWSPRLKNASPSPGVLPAKLAPLGLVQLQQCLLPMSRHRCLRSPAQWHCCHEAYTALLNALV